MGEVNVVIFSYCLARMCVTITRKAVGLRVV